MTIHDSFWFFALLGIVPLLAGVFYLSYRLQARRLHTFIAARLRGLLVQGDNRGRRVVSLVLVSLAVLLLVFSLARPLLHEREEVVELRLQTPHQTLLCRWGGRRAVARRVRPPPR